MSNKVPNNNIHNHEINLEMKNYEWICDICDNSYYQRRSWSCEICEFDVCVICYWK